MRWPLHQPPPSLRRLARIGKDDLRLPLVINDLSGDADPLTTQRDLGDAKFLAMIAVDDRGEGRIGVGPPEVQ